jgi:hypothetical protein
MLLIGGGLIVSGLAMLGVTDTPASAINGVEPQD